MGRKSMRIYYNGFWNMRFDPTCTEKYGFDRIDGANIGGWYFTVDPWDGGFPWKRGMHL